MSKLKINWETATWREVTIAIREHNRRNHMSDHRELNELDRAHARAVHMVGYGHAACGITMPPGAWPPGHYWSNDWAEVTCPDCLRGKPGIETFTLAPDGKSITCKRCKRTSHTPDDVEQHYCGRCHVFHDDLWPPARQWWIDHPDQGHERIHREDRERLGGARVSTRRSFTSKGRRHCRQTVRQSSYKAGAAADTIKDIERSLAANTRAERILRELERPKP